jgi:hypothetical protein
MIMLSGHFDLWAGPASRKRNPDGIAIARLLLPASNSASLDRDRERVRLSRPLSHPSSK